MKIKTYEVLNLLPVLAGAKMSKLEPKEKTSVVKAVVALRSESQKWESFVKEAQEKCRPEGFEELARKYREVDSLPEAEREDVKRRWAEYSAAVDEVARPEFEAERELPGIGLSEDALARLADSNPDWTAGTVVTLMDILTEPKGEA